MFWRYIGNIVSQLATLATSSLQFSTDSNHRFHYLSDVNYQLQVMLTIKFYISCGLYMFLSTLVACQLYMLLVASFISFLLHQVLATLYQLLALHVTCYIYSLLALHVTCYISCKQLYVLLAILAASNSTYYLLLVDTYSCQQIMQSRQKSYTQSCQQRVHLVTS